MTDRLTIGQLAREAATSADTIRYYERLRLLPQAYRTAAGYRMFGVEAAKRLIVIQRAKAFGFSLKEIAVFMRTRDEGRKPCHEVRAAAERKLIELDARIRDLNAARKTMRRTLSEWDRVLAATPDGELAHLFERMPTASSVIGRADVRKRRST